MTIRLLLIIITAGLSTWATARDITSGKRIHYNASRGYAPFGHATPSGVDINNDTPLAVSDSISLPDSLSDFSITFRASNLACHPARRAIFTGPDGKRHSRHNPEWSFWLASASTDTLFFTVKSEEIPDLISSTPAVRLTVTSSSDSSLNISRALTEEISCHSDPNIWQVSVSPEALSVSAGNRRLLPTIEIPGHRGCFSTFGFRVSPAAHLLATDITVADNMPADSPLRRLLINPETLKETLQSSSDPLEGYWTMFDRTLDETLLQLGGDYRLAIIKDDGRYLAVYLAGAKTNALMWKPGMVKAIFTPDPFPDTFSVEWHDAEGRTLSKDIKAQLDEDMTLSIQFPYQSSVMRLRRIP